MDSESLTLEELNLNYKDFRSLNEIQDKKVHLLEVKAIILAGAFVIFQGNIYAQLNFPSASSQATVWIRLCLSILVSVAFWLAFVPTVNGSMRIRRQQDSTFMEQESLYRKIYSIRTGRRQSDGGAAAWQTLAKSFAFVRCQRYAYVAALHSALFFFTVLVTYALLSINPHSPISSTAVSTKLSFD